MTQCERILKWLDDFGSISTLDAFRELGITRLASRIHDLKRRGVRITSETVCSRNRYGEKVHFAVYRRAA